MQLTKHTDYAIRVLIYLVRQEEATISQMADYYQISRNHLVKVVHSLSRKGFVITTRGKNGGVKLARAAAQIRVGDVVRCMEPNFNMVECFNYKRAHCAALPVCGLKSAFNLAAHQFLSVLDGYTVADALLTDKIAVSAQPQPADTAQALAEESA